MEDLVRRMLSMTGRRWLTHGLLLDRCPEVIQGFETIVTLVPQTHRSTHPVGILTLNQNGTFEGVKRHMDTLVKILLQNKTSPYFFAQKLPLIVTNLPDDLMDEVISSCTRTVAEHHGDALQKLYPHLTDDQILKLIQEKLVAPSFVTFHELLALNTDEVMRQLQLTAGSTDPSYFRAIINLLQSPACTLNDFRRIHMYFMNPNIETYIREFWRVWSHEQVAYKVFPVSGPPSPRETADTLGVCATSTVDLTDICVLNTSLGAQMPIRDGLLNVIKSLKNQDMLVSPPASPPGEKLAPRRPRGPCACAVCKGPPKLRPDRVDLERRNSRFHRPLPCYRLVPYQQPLGGDKEQLLHEMKPYFSHPPPPLLLNVYPAAAAAHAPPFTWRMFSY